MKQHIARLLATAAVLAGLVAVGGIAPRAFAAPTDPVQSNSVGLEGTVRADPPKTPASITFPSNGQSFTTLPVRVGGTCPDDVLVKVFSNGVFVGSAQCTNGTFSLSVDLFSGQNDLIARVYDALDQVGPDSNTVSVRFTPTGFNDNAPRISLTSTYAKRGANPGDTLDWPIVLSGGTGPYAISVDWGDGNTELISRSAAGEFTISHKYARPGVYTLIIKATDSAGNSAFLQLVGVGNGALAQDNQSASSANNTRVIYIWWPLIVAAVMVIFSFWLGSRHRLDKLRRQAEEHV